MKKLLFKLFLVVIVAFSLASLSFAEGTATEQINATLDQFVASQLNQNLDQFLSLVTDPVIGESGGNVPAGPVSQQEIRAYYSQHGMNNFIALEYRNRQLNLIDETHATVTGVFYIVVNVDGAPKQADVNSKFTLVKSDKWRISAMVKL